MKKLGTAFYLILLALTLLVLGTLVLWFLKKNDVFLYLTIALFALYLFHLVFGMVRGYKREKREQTTEDLLRAELKGGSCVVYLTSPPPIRRNTLRRSTRLRWTANA